MAEKTLNPEVKKKWLDALRSGEYPQTQSVLKNEKGFCCLGVLCDVYAEEKNIQWGKEVTTSGNVPGTLFLGDAVYPPDGVMDWAEFPNDQSKVPGLADREGHPVYLTRLNDEERLTFSQIADLVEYFF